MTPGQALLIRADATLQIGTGHVMRCLALAQGWQDAGGAVIFVSAPLPPALEARLRAEGLAVAVLQTAPGSEADAAETARQAKEQGAAWVAVDGYQFDADYQKAIKDAGFKLLVLDDNGDADYYWADFVLNQNIHAQADWYANRASYTRLLLGTQYALLRREFTPWRGWQRDIPEIAYKILVTLGGSDPDNVTLKILEALSLVRAERLEATVVIGGGNPHRASLEAAGKEAGFPLRFVVNAPNMPELMAWADIAVSAGGSTCWELAYMGLPTLILATAENQRLSVEALDKSGAAIYLGWHLECSREQISQSLAHMLLDYKGRAAQSGRGRQLVDGSGKERVLESLRGDYAE